jgi:two-component system sensor histidine kinase BaeS
MRRLSFRARVSLLIFVVAASTAGATAWLTVRQTTEQVTQSAVVDHAGSSAEYIRSGLRGYFEPYVMDKYLASCMRDHGYQPRVTAGTSGGRHLAQIGPCRSIPWGGATDPYLDRFVVGTLTKCGTDTACVIRECARLLDELSPPPAKILLGSMDQPPPPPRISVAPALLVAGLVTLVALTAALLISTRVLRPISALAAASQRIGDGALDERVPVQGDDELARLGQAFNRMAESLQRSKEQQHTMIDDIAHELRTPIANIRGYLEGLQDGVFPPDQELFQSLYEEALLQQRLIDDLQELALAESGSLEYHPALLDLAELVRTAATAHAATATVRIEVQTPGPVPVLADPDRLRQVTANLLANALRATAPGGTVTLYAHRQGDSAFLRVADTGHGISAADLPHVFDRFWRADSSRGRHTGGRGLGLAITREIVTAHGGTITVASALGSGSVFTVRLPLAEELSTVPFHRGDLGEPVLDLPRHLFRNS